MTTFVTWFASETQARSAMLDLITGGVPRDNISVVLGAPQAGAEERSEPPGFMMSLMDAGSVTLPGIGSVFAAGPLAAALGSAGDIQSALVNDGTPADQAGALVGKLSQGGALLAVQVSPELELIVQGVMRHNLDPDSLAEAEPVGSTADDEMGNPDDRGLASQSIGAMSSGVVPGAWGNAGAVLDEPIAPPPSDRGPREHDI